ncbi:acetoacetate decarboxylase family protein [Desulforhopalus singaporensis]|uniref:Acetoacetate decarboxylase n=1 Tax=Desulforhopalus singaporensis TaxID=91360 RepID=A0A1H0V837_9BACT|nr:acetoacetate decarboxylase family protein [Desulforhopalus singaporensis]SDP74610.1 acetoacetate decarboxylase [Desulforhopalus singaporensis]
MSKYVKTPEELAEIQEMMNKGRFTCQSLIIEFETTPEYIKSVLAPCFEMGDQPLGWAHVGKWQSDMCGEFDCGIIYFPVKYKALSGKVYEGTTMMTLFVGNDMPVSIGREMWGEGKKTATAQLLYDGDEVYGYVERNGVRIIQISAKLGADQGPQPTVKADDFEFKCQPHVTGYGIQNDPIILNMHAEDTYRVYKEGTGELILTGTNVDPLDEIPIVKVNGVTYSEGASIWTIPFHDVLVGKGEEFLPYMYGQKYDDFRLLEKPMRWRK